MANLLYTRVSTAEQSTEMQRHALMIPGGFDREYKDVGISGSIPAADRQGFGEMLKYAREGDTLHVYAVDRLGRDALDVQSTVRALLDKGVSVEIRGLGRISRGVGELILAVLAQVADMERRRITERAADGRNKAREALLATGMTHRGKASLGRPHADDPMKVAAWRMDHEKSIANTAEHFQLSPATVKRYCLEFAVRHPNAGA